ncbi:hypothetical protein Tco_0723326, partial [Tanacetum coccineum]
MDLGVGSGRDVGQGMKKQAKAQGGHREEEKCKGDLGSSCSLYAAKSLHNNIFIKRDLCEVPVVSTDEVNISTAGRTVTYSRRSEEKRTRKDKGKVIMTEPEPKKKSKKEFEQERLSFAEAIRLQEQMDGEQRVQIARDEEIARQWDEEEGQIVISEAKSTKEIDWNDPLVIRYHALKMKPKTIAQARRSMVKYLKNQGNYKISDFKGMSYNEIRPIFEKV